jgi:hypothetical protein
LARGLFKIELSNIPLEAYQFGSLNELELAFTSQLLFVHAAKLNELKHYR